MVNQEEYNKLVRKDAHAITRFGRRWDTLTWEKQESIYRDAKAQGYPKLKEDPGEVIK